MSEKRRYLALTVFFLVLSGVMTLFHAPLKMSWRTHAFQDAGANLTIGRLTEMGDRPGIDNGHIYGLLCVLAGRLCYGIAGPTPWASFTLWVVGNLVMAWGMARYAFHARVGPIGLLMMTSGMILAKDQTFVYTLEPCFLIHAFAEQARGRRGIALALATACAFVKPSMAGCYGLLLVIAILGGWGDRGEGQTSLATRIRQLIPAFLTGSALLALLAGLYGVAALINSLVPVHAAAIYREKHFGFFFGVGRRFWYFPGVRPGYYIGTPTGFWLAGTVVLVLGAIGALVSRLRKLGDKSARMNSNTEMILTLTILHVIFICIFFAHQFSYDYYYYLPVLGLATLASRSKWHRLAVLVLSLLSLLGNKGHIQDDIQAWRTRRPYPEMRGLWSGPEDIREWREVLRLIDGGPAALLSITEGATVMIPQLAPPVLFYLETGQLTPREIDRKLSQLRSERFVVEVRTVDQSWPSERWPIFLEPLEKYDLVMSGELYRVYRRRESKGS
jgi:hypothetical protein